MITVKTDYPIALDSPDHLYPWGTRRDNLRSVDYSFQKGAIEMFGRNMSFMDLGCAGGGLAIQFHEMGCLSVGLEGSDYNLIHENSTQTIYHIDEEKLKKSSIKIENEDGKIIDLSSLDTKQNPAGAGWKKEDRGIVFVIDKNPTDLHKQWVDYNNKVLFTCDISRPFQVLNDGEPAKFDLITCWEVIEHIVPERLSVLWENVRNHLKPAGIFIGTISLNDDMIKVSDNHSVNLHRSIFSLSQWDKILREQFIYGPWPEKLDRLRFDQQSIHFCFQPRREIK